MTIALRLLALIAVLMLPFGMAAAPAETHQMQTAAEMPSEHCPEEPSNMDSQGVLADCTMACSAALPAVDGAPIESQAFAGTPAERSADLNLPGIAPEIATPPPKLS